MCLHHIVVGIIFNRKKSVFGAEVYLTTKILGYHAQGPGLKGNKEE